MRLVYVLNMSSSLNKDIIIILLLLSQIRLNIFYCNQLTMG